MIETYGCQTLFDYYMRQVAEARQQRIERRRQRRLAKAAKEST